MFVTVWDLGSEGLSWSMGMQQLVLLQMESAGKRAAGTALDIACEAVLVYPLVL
jgi:hypothetical protein